MKLVPGMEKAAAFLETHRYAALVGASMGFTKMEGTTVNAADKRAYSAMSYIYKSMTDGTTDIKVQGPVAGAVYEHVLKAARSTATASASTANGCRRTCRRRRVWSAKTCGADALGNTANPDKIANPDNLKYSRGDAHAVHRRGQRQPREQLPVGVQRGHRRS